MNSNELASKLIGRIMAKSWADENFKKRLLADANATLTAEGVKIPEGVTVKVVENTDNVINYVLPKNPSDAADLEMVGADNYNMAKCHDAFGQPCQR